MKPLTKIHWETLRFIHHHGPASRPDIARQLALSPATVSTTVRDLLASGWVTESDYRESHGGRKAALLTLKPDALSAIGVELGYNRLAVAHVSLNGHIIEQRSFTETGPDAAATLDALASALQALLPQHHQPTRFAGIAVAVSGIILDGNRISRHYPGLPTWDNVPLAQSLEERIGIRPVILNHASAAAFGEHRFGGWQDADHLAYLDMGRGIAVGAVIGGRICAGAHGNAGELGHTAVEDNGPLCYCGNRGCLETFAAPNAILRQYAEAVSREGRAVPPNLTLDDLFRAAASGDRFAHTLLAEAGQRLGRATANLVNLLNPSLLILGGVLTRHQEPLASAFTAILRARILPALRDAIRVEISHLGEQACVLGAAAAMMDSFFGKPWQRA